MLCRMSNQCPYAYRQHWLINVQIGQWPLLLLLRSSLQKELVAQQQGLPLGDSFQLLDPLGRPQPCSSWGSPSFLINSIDIGWLLLGVRHNKRNQRWRFKVLLYQENRCVVTAPVLREPHVRRGVWMSRVSAHGSDARKKEREGCQFLPRIGQVSWRCWHSL